MISVLEAEAISLEEIEEFLRGSESVRFEGQSRERVYGWVEQLLCRQEYGGQPRRAKGLLRAYIGKMTGLSRAQVARLIGRYQQSGRVKIKSSKRHRFAQRYTLRDIELLARVDQAHESLSGPATQRILKREWEVYGKAEFERLAQISNGHLYNLRKHLRYRERLQQYAKTRPVAIAIGERRKPDPQGQPGYLRIDTVHQGDTPEQKGLYHINAVDEVTQWEVVLATARISEAYLLPLLENLLAQFPFRILGLHSDNGSEYINQAVAKMLEKLCIEQTKSRPRRSGDNGMVETKNGAIIRKHVGWGHIDQRYSEPFNQFYTAFLNPYLNYHRPSAQAEILVDGKGRKRRRYACWQTPLEKLLSLGTPQQYLRAGLTPEALQRVALALSDTEAAQRMQQAKQELFAQIRRTA